jgi:hypothetical protein
MENHEKIQSGQPVSKAIQESRNFRTQSKSANHLALMFGNSFLFIRMLLCTHECAPVTGYRVAYIKEGNLFHSLVAH